MDLQVRLILIAEVVSFAVGTIIKGSDLKKLPEDPPKKGFQKMDPQV